MIFHENRLLADDSHVISYLIFVENWERYVSKFVVCMRGSRKFCQGGPTVTFFLVDEGREDPNTTISGPSSARQRSAI